jgi:hypothetical protein
MFFMRAIMLLPLLLVAGCSEESPPAEQQEQAAAEHIRGGQWEMTTEVTKVVARDKGKPAVNMPQGARTTSRSCVAEADAKKPPAALFAPEGFKCDYRDAYMRNGRINSTLACTRAGLGGDIAMVVNGSYTADTIEGTSTIETRLVGEGDQKIDTKIAGRRTGHCSVAPAKS